MRWLDNSGDEESLYSPLISAVEKLSQKVQKLEENMSYSPPVRASISAIRSRRFSTRERIQRVHTTRQPVVYLGDHGEDMRK
ncbi:hypothetical protein llap_14462 [Limosa lapponica baueri]|uniref:Uncharacterized protein n=1 Tax=Limosa lapponica baueri TaxID=1758121 RepID=A0A2I0TNA9_LIMLA|nr:hypothetical protein llap_14462 [Limosa lapponica baueri]